MFTGTGLLRQVRHFEQPVFGLPRAKLPPDTNLVDGDLVLGRSCAPFAPPPGPTKAPAHRPRKVMALSLTCAVMQIGSADSAPCRACGTRLRAPSRRSAIGRSTSPAAIADTVARLCQPAPLPGPCAVHRCRNAAQRRVAPLHLEQLAALMRGQYGPPTPPRLRRYRRAHRVAPAP